MSIGTGYLKLQMFMSSGPADLLLDILANAAVTWAVVYVYLRKVVFKCIRQLLC